MGIDNCHERCSMEVHSLSLNRNDLVSIYFVKHMKIFLKKKKKPQILKQKVAKMFIWIIIKCKLRTAVFG